MNEIESIAKSLNMRIGQLMCNAMEWLDPGCDIALFYISDEELLQACKDYARACQS